MEEYLQHMKTLRSQMNDVEDQAAKISVEEQTQITTIQTLEKDVHSANSQTKQLKEDIEQMMKAKGQTCAQILEKQRRISALESDSSTLTQTLELIHQERDTLSAKFIEKSTYYTKVAEDINTKLQKQQVMAQNDEQTAGAEGKSSIDNHLIMDNQVGNFSHEFRFEELQPSNSLKYQRNEARKNLQAKLDTAKAKLDSITQMKSELLRENNKLKQFMDQAKCRANDFKPELLAMDTETLEEEGRALESDKAGETEYLQSLHNQIEKLKGISHVITCACGEKYKVVVDICA
ncbi:LOW QUALITY PROTEIN: hypothetical protein CFOL_v3_15509 [Cephalotus follicularis]|uniref:Uncharacterized protein n=1 Tax=Cephalotus follicularis TaxID=3775 RepID=A0A1Q3BVL0_CEPFO|nr:LOW QUALITY PROTEIN: hypothetical protein CFOL_v3_15509 [Cephalotus follicularis]